VVATLHSSGSFFSLPERFVIRDQAFLDAVRARFPVPELEPAIDFSNEMVIVVFQGTQPTGGYSIRVEEVTLRNTDLTVVVRSRTPGQYCVVTLGVTAPLQVIRLPRYDGYVHFFEESQAFDCSSHFYPF
jgi:hypothetical protein